MAEGEFPLVNLYLYVTDRCNLKCRHCWISPIWHQDHIEPEISVKEYIKFIEQALELGLKHVKLTGGEPLLRSDLVELLEFLFEKNLYIGIETNGTLITDEIADFLQRVKTDIAVSLDAADPKIHDDLRRVNGSHERSLRGIHKLIEHGIKIEVIMALYRPNVHQIKPLLQLCHDLGIACLKINPIHGMGRATKLGKAGLLLSNRELLDLQYELEENLRSKYSVPILLDTPCSFTPLKTIRRNKIPTCPFKYLLGVLANGDISFCGWGYANPSWIMGNIRSVNLKQLWENHPLLNEAREKIPTELEGVCASCLFKKCCQGKCRAYALCVYDSLLAPDPSCQTLYEESLFPATRLLEASKQEYLAL